MMKKWLYDGMIKWDRIVYLLLPLFEKNIDFPYRWYFLPESKGRKFHLHVPQYVFTYLTMDIWRILLPLPLFYIYRFFRIEHFLTPLYILRKRHQRTDRWTDGPTDGRTDRRTDPLIEMQERIYNIRFLFWNSNNDVRHQTMPPKLLKPLYHTFFKQYMFVDKI